MADTLAKELADSKAALTERDEQIAVLKQETEEQGSHIEALESTAKENAEAADVSKAEAKEEGSKESLALVSARVEKYGAEFAVEHIAKSDEECQAAYIVQLEAEKKVLADKQVAKVVDGVTPVAFASDDGSPKKTVKSLLFGNK